MSDWSSVYDANSTDEKYDAFLTIWDRYIDIHCPTKTITFKHRECPWLTENDDIMQLKARRDSARREKDRSGTPDAASAHAELKKEFENVLREAKSRFFDDSPSETSKERWTKIRRYAISDGKPCRTSSTLDEKTANKFNEYFSGVGKRIADTLRTTSIHQMSLRLPRVVSNSFKVHPVTLPELSLALRRMSSSKSVGPDGVSIQLLRRCFEVVGPHLLHVINSSLRTGSVPALWKKAIIVPLHKSGPTSEPGNFRPISVLSVVGKLTEKVVSDQLLKYVTDNHIISDNQYAYRPRLSTEDATLDLVTQISRNMDAGQVSTVCSCDLSKAFDCVNRTSLISKLQCYGISPHWLEGYFENRQQIVKGGTDSKEVPFGVVQGSILGPLLFLIMTNDLQCYVSSSCKLVSYADDTQLVHSGLPTDSGLEDLRTIIESDLKMAAAWYKTNGLKINPTKTEFLVVGTPAQTRKSASLRVKFEDSVLSSSDNIKILGITIDKNLTWHHQTGKVVKKCFSALVTINKLRHVLPTQTVKTLIQTLAFSHLMYCLPAWAPTTDIERKRLNKAINFAVRIATGKRKMERITQARLDLGWLDFTETINYRDCVRMHNMVHRQDGSTTLRKLIKPRHDISTRITRESADPTIMQASDTRPLHLETVRKMFPHRALQTWNALPANIRKEKSLEKFKHDFKLPN